MIDFFEGELLVNNSYSGNHVMRLTGSEVCFPSGCSDERTNALHVNDIMLDVIIIFLGANDWVYGSFFAYADILEEEITPYCDSFETAYELMLRKIKKIILRLL